jgi:hypothetical protein
VALLRECLPKTTEDPAILEYAMQNKMVLVTCNRKDFVPLGKACAHRGIIVLIRRRSRHAELAKLLALVRGAGETGLIGNTNFA